MAISPFIDLENFALHYRFCETMALDLRALGLQRWRRQSGARIHEEFVDHFRSFEPWPFMYGYV